MSTETYIVDIKHTGKWYCIPWGVKIKHVSVCLSICVMRDWELAVAHRIIKFDRKKNEAKNLASWWFFPLFFFYSSGSDIFI